VELLGVPFELVLFALVLAGVALLHDRTFEIALCGLVAVTLYELAFTGFHGTPGLAGLLDHLAHEWPTLANLLCLLLGFALLSDHFERSRLPALLPRFLPDDWRGAFALLAVVFVLSSFLDNIAAALIGGAIAHTVFRGRIHIGYLAAIVAASNAGGSGSVVGDTTTTMMWIDGISPRAIVHAYAAALPALFVFGIPAALQQQRHQPILKDAPAGVRLDWRRIAVVTIVLAAAIAANVGANVGIPEPADSFPFVGVAVALALLATVPLCSPSWSLIPSSLKGALFLLCLVTTATLMPVERLPAASWQTALGLGFVSAVFDNIPLTALALAQGGYDWGVLAYCVGYGGSMLWFGSSAGVAIANMYPEAKSVGAWLLGGWHVLLGYVVGFAVLIAALGWRPS